MFKKKNNTELTNTSNNINKQILLTPEFYKLKILKTKSKKNNTNKTKKLAINTNTYVKEFIKQNIVNVKQSDYELLEYTKPLKLLETEIIYSLVKFNFSGNPTKPILFVIPGYSSKSMKWTLSRINTFVNIFIDRLKSRYSAVYIINYENVKGIQDANKGMRDELDEQIALHTKQIIMDLGITKKNASKLVLLGRSAGGGIALQLINMSELPITHCYLACAGGKMSLFEDYLSNPKSNKKIKIVLGWSKNDNKIPFSRNGVSMLDTAKKYRFKNISKVLINTSNDLDDFNHRIHPQLLYKL